MKKYPAENIIIGLLFMDKQEAYCSVEEDGYNEKINEEIKRTLMRRDETGI